MSVRRGLRDAHRLGWDDVARATQEVAASNDVELVVRLTPGYGGTNDGRWYIEVLAYPRGKANTGRHLNRVVGWYPNGRATTAAAAVYRLVLDMDYVLGPGLPDC